MGFRSTGPKILNRNFLMHSYYSVMNHPETEMSYRFVSLRENKARLSRTKFSHFQIAVHDTVNGRGSYQAKRCTTNIAA